MLLNIDYGRGYFFKQKLLLQSLMIQRRISHLNSNKMSKDEKSEKNDALLLKQKKQRMLSRR